MFHRKRSPHILPKEPRTHTQPHAFQRTPSRVKRVEGDLNYDAVFHAGSISCLVIAVAVLVVGITVAAVVLVIVIQSLKSAW